MLATKAGVDSLHYQNQLKTRLPSSIDPPPAAQARLKPTTEESPLTGEKPNGTEEDQQDQQDQQDQGSTDGTSEDPTASSQGGRRGTRKGGGAAADVDQEEETNQEETEDEQEFSEWRVHPRLTPRKDMALQVWWRLYRLRRKLETATINRLFRHNFNPNVDAHLVCSCRSTTALRTPTPRHLHVMELLHNVAQTSIN